MVNSKHYQPEEKRLRHVSTKFQDKYKHLDKYPKRVYNMVNEDDESDILIDEDEYDSIED